MKCLVKDCETQLSPFNKTGRCRSCAAKKRRRITPPIVSAKVKIAKFKTIKQIPRKSMNVGEANGNWKGDNIKCIVAIHNWVRRRKSKPELCEKCQKAAPFDLANISGLYKRDINDYRWICRKCHMIEDGRLKNLKRGR